MKMTDGEGNALNDDQIGDVLYVGELLEQENIQRFLDRALSFKWLPKTNTLKVTADQSRTKWIKKEHFWTPSQAIAHWEEYKQYHPEHIARMTREKRAVESRRIEKSLIERVRFMNATTDGGRYKYMKYNKLERELRALFEIVSSIDHWEEVGRLTRTTELPFDEIKKFEIIEIPIPFLATEQTIFQELERSARLLNEEYAEDKDNTSEDYDYWFAKFTNWKELNKAEREAYWADTVANRKEIMDKRGSKYLRAPEDWTDEEAYGRWIDTVQQLAAIEAELEAEYSFKRNTELASWLESKFGGEKVKFDDLDESSVDLDDFEESDSA